MPRNKRYNNTFLDPKVSAPPLFTKQQFQGWQIFFIDIQLDCLSIQPLGFALVEHLGIASKPNQMSQGFFTVFLCFKKNCQKARMLITKKSRSLYFDQPPHRVGSESDSNGHLPKTDRQQKHNPKISKVVGGLLVPSTLGPYIDIIYAP